MGNNENDLSDKQDNKKTLSDTVEVKTPNFLKTHMTVPIEGTILSEYVEIVKLGGDDTNPIYGYWSGYFNKNIIL